MGCRGAGDRGRRRRAGRGRPPVKPPWMLVVGNEGAGVRAEIREAAGALAAVPMAGAADSLNAAVAGAVVLYALTRA